MRQIIINKEVTLCLIQDFDLIPDDLEGMLEISEIKKKLKNVINYLLNKDFNKLLNIFYRIDLNEVKVKSILNTASPSEISSLLADLVIEREMQKALTRLRYKNLP